jgi:hypothetical protein
VYNQVTPFGDSLRRSAATSTADVCGSSTHATREDSTRARPPSITMHGVCRPHVCFGATAECPLADQLVARLAQFMSFGLKVAQHRLIESTA